MDRNPLKNRISNYEIAKKNAQASFHEYDHRKIAEKRGLQMDDRYVYIDLFDRHYRADRISGMMEWSCGKQEKTVYREADFNEVMTLLDIMCYSMEGAKASGEYTVLQNLSKVQTAQYGAGKGFFSAETLLFDGRNTELKKACEMLGGTAFGKGDVGMKIPAFEDIFIVLRFWNSDEDFPAEMSVMCDTNLCRFMHYETVWYMASELISRIKENFISIMERKTGENDR